MLYFLASPNYSTSARLVEKENAEIESFHLNVTHQVTHQSPGARPHLLRRTNKAIRLSGPTSS